MSRNSQDESTRENAPVPSLMTLISSIFSVPRAIYERGVERGDEWRQKRGQVNQETEEYDGKCRQWKSWHQDSHPFDSSAHSSKSLSDYPSPGGSNNRDDWISWIKQELAKRERIAKEVYESWEQIVKPDEDTKNPSQQELSRAQDFLCELEKSSNQKLEALYQISALSRDQHSAEQHLSIEQALPEQPLSKAITTKHASKDHSVTYETLTGTACHADQAAMSEERRGGPFQPLVESLLTNMLSLGTKDWDYDDSSAVVSIMTAYAASSPYSPLALENQQGFDTLWRARFEDLLRAEAGRSLLTNEEIKVSKRIPGPEWLIGLLSRCLSQNSGSPNASSCEANHRSVARTELDAYISLRDQLKPSFLRDAIRRQRQNIENEWSRTSDIGADDESLVNTSTRTVNSKAELDGSVTKKTMIHRRFNDGREERSEIVERIPPPSSTALKVTTEPRSEKTSSVQYATDFISQQDNTNSQNPGKGWFWSK